MSDVHSTEVRRRNMAAIRAKDTRPELLVRRSLHAAGYRFRLHDARLPGRPDIVLAKHSVVILLNGCFFHGHDCDYFRWPKTRAEFWRMKISGNRQRDVRNVAQLRSEGWRVLTVWECALRGDRTRRAATMSSVIKWIRSASRRRQIGMRTSALSARKQASLVRVET
jgi:DNA mismatch endonuclease, patch repair protein